jgi:hypothetical protein
MEALGENLVSAKMVCVGGDGLTSSATLSIRQQKILTVSVSVSSDFHAEKSHKINDVIGSFIIEWE